MVKTKLHVVFLRYLRQNLKTILFFIMSMLIFAVVFYLYFLPLEAVLYAGLLSFSLGILFIIYDFNKFYKKHAVLCSLVRSISVNIDLLPETSSLIEKDYQALLFEVYKNKVDLMSQADSRRTDMIDYYTLWAHQIKTPISAMKILLQEESTNENSQLLQELFKIERYVEMVLQYLRLENMSSDLKIEKYNLSEIIKQAVKKYAPIFIHKKIKLDFREMNCLVLTDEKWLVFVIEQIISNALKYTPKGTISIYMEEISEKPSEKKLVIEDTGIGIQQEDIPRVFEKGFTGYNGRMDKKSTGIGLYLCKQILNKLSHEVTIKSKLGVGTKVMIDLSSDETFID